ncbi:GINS complex subunit 1 [Marchantia polymorpha subsp. ruderalis]|uniref:Uncharacterized protein n=2 Tax=Marchantia polymorpha TaxID=3197 RepID=A0A176WGB2_MARPO|nr:hypothetical protein AXG93_4510s1090 [Marchantia polymorpha subsp. ruderalis]PTQ47500.1 hypothetical protein MARPO_0008s0246 [Marchantia polymorpha]BBN19333.1 hypothetical protein Mp_8g09750 [Marchantia polymorpha subsp. ruderalis]|eukprot:PTQ47500.1 hypothetical protein MARPO_0008s0246 [Marchantia polymorpha]
MAMFGKKGAELVREAKQAQATVDQFRPFNKDLFEQVIKETEEHYSHLQERMSQIRISEPSQGVDPNFVGGCAQHRSVLRNKRCLLAYVNARLGKIQQLRWDLGAVLPDDIAENLSATERTFFQGYSDALGSYMNDINLDLTVDATPPKDPYVQIRVIGNLGEVLLDDQETSLLPNSIHFMTRTEAEPLVLQGLLEIYMG